MSRHPTPLSIRMNRSLLMRLLWDLALGNKDYVIGQALKLLIIFKTLMQLMLNNAEWGWMMRWWWLHWFAWLWTSWLQWFSDTATIYLGCVQHNYSQIGDSEFQSIEFDTIMLCQSLDAIIQWGAVVFVFVKQYLQLI